MNSRRSVLKFLAGFSLAGLSPQALGAIEKPVNRSPKKFDKRLIGEWISNRQKTIEHYRFKDGVTPEKRKNLEEFFGRLRIRFTESEMQSELDGHVEIGPYEVIASDNHSVVILGRDVEGPALIQIHFEEDGYYLLSGYALEFFKRIS